MYREVSFSDKYFITGLYLCIVTSNDIVNMSPVIHYLKINMQAVPARIFHVDRCEKLVSAADTAIRAEKHSQAYWQYVENVF